MTIEEVVLCPNATICGNDAAFVAHVEGQQLRIYAEDGTVDETTDEQYDLIELQCAECESTDIERR